MVLFCMPVPYWSVLSELLSKEEEEGDMDNMTGAEKAKRSETIFALLVAFIFLFPIYWLIQISLVRCRNIWKVLTYFPHDFTFEPWLEKLNR